MRRAIVLATIAAFGLAPAATALFTPCLPAAFGNAPWRDCNGDGFEGLGQLQINPYRAELLLDHSVCPVGAADPVSGLVYNDGTCVRERG